MNGFSSEMAIPLIIAAVTLAVVVIVSVTALAGWRDWIALRRDQLSAGKSVVAVNRIGRASARCGGRVLDADSYNADGDDAGVMMNRIELADLRERMRKLEAIAAGVDL